MFEYRASEVHLNHRFKTVICNFASSCFRTVRVLGNEEERHRFRVVSERDCVALPGRTQ